MKQFSEKKSQNVFKICHQDQCRIFSENSTKFMKFDQTYDTIKTEKW